MIEGLKAPIWGVTAAGAVVGLWGGPAGVLIGAGIGGVIDLLRYEYARRWHGWHPLEEHHLRGVRRAAPGVPDAVIQQKAAEAGALITAPAMILQALLEDYAAHRAKPVFWKTPVVRNAVRAFQTAYNSDPQTSQGLGRLEVTGKFTPKTAAALTLYTHKSVSPDPAVS